MKMLERFQFGTPIKTGAVVEEISISNKELPFFEIKKEENKIHFLYSLGDKDKIYGLGEQIRGINKRGWTYTSYCADEGYYTEDILFMAHIIFSS